MTETLALVRQHLMMRLGVDGPEDIEAVLGNQAPFGGDAAQARAFVGIVLFQGNSAEKRVTGHTTKIGPTTFARGVAGLGI